MTTRIQSGDTDRIWLFAGDYSGTGVTGIAANISIKIRRKSDGFYWSGAAFASGVTSLTPTEASAADLPGHYYYDFASPSSLSDTVTYSATCSSASVQTDPWVGQCIVGGYTNYLNTSLSTIYSVVNSIFSTVSAISSTVTATAASVTSTVIPLLSLLRSTLIIQQENLKGVLEDIKGVAKLDNLMRSLGEQIREVKDFLSTVKRR